MAFAWNAWGLVFLLLAAMAGASGWLVYATRPDRRQNRLLALVLLFETAVLATAALSLLSASPRDVYAIRVVNQVVAWPFVAAYLAFLGTLETPLAGPLSGGRVRGVLVVLALVGSASVLAWEEGYVTGVRSTVPFGTYDAVWGPANVVVGVGMAGALLLGLAFAFSAWRRAAPGSATRSRAGIFLLAFGWRDAILLASLVPIYGADLAAPSEPLMRLNWSLQVAAWSVYPLLLAYGILRHQLFDIDLRIKWTIRGGTVAAGFVAAFFVVSEGAQQVFSDTLGPLAGLLAAGLLVFAIAPLQRLGERIADRALPHVADNEEYRRVRTREVYRAAVEAALVDGELTERERDILARLQDELALSASEARAIERDLPRG